MNLTMNPVPNEKNIECGYWMPTIILDEKINIDRKKLLQKFEDNNIDGRVFFYPLSSLPMFKERKENIVSYDIFNRGINLPSFHEITDQDIEKVVKMISNEQ